MILNNQVQAKIPQNDVLDCSIKQNETWRMRVSNTKYATYKPTHEAGGCYEIFTIEVFWIDSKRKLTLQLS